MTRRSIFKSLVSCVVASSMEVMGWRMPVGPRGVPGPVGPCGPRGEFGLAQELYEKAQYEEVVFYFGSPLQAKWVNPAPVVGCRYDFKDGEWVKRPRPES